MAVLVVAVLLTFHLLSKLQASNVTVSMDYQPFHRRNQQPNMEVGTEIDMDYTEEVVGGMIIESMILTSPDVLAEGAERIRKEPPPETFMPRFEEHGSLLKNFLVFMWAWFKLTFFLTTYSMVCFYAVEYMFHRNIEDN